MYLCWSLFSTLFKRDSTQVFSCEYCDILKFIGIQSYFSYLTEGEKVDLGTESDFGGVVINCITFQWPKKQTAYFLEIHLH